MKVWLVEADYYEQKHVAAIFSSEDKAKEYQQQKNRSYSKTVGRTEEFYADPYDVEVDAEVR